MRWKDYLVCTNFINENIKNDLRLSVFPNPTTSIANVVGLEKVLPVYVYDISGKIVFESLVDPLNNKVDLSNCNSGLYFIRLGYNYIETIKE